MSLISAGKSPQQSTRGGKFAVHGSPEREQAIKFAYEQLLATLEGVRSALNLIAIAVILIAVKLWLR